jgi:phosphatidylserine/phosphatidylglycerophosphate/cardiolipin synthase-like enzyme
METLALLAKTLTASQATSIAASLEIDGRLDNALAAFPHSAHPAVGLLDDALTELGDASILASVLRGFASAATVANPPRAVWSGPTFDGDSDHTTSAVAHLIDDATEDVFASTFSATLGSPFVEALWRAIARGVSVTVLVEASRMKETVAKLQQFLSGATFLAYVPPFGDYGIQHSKVVIVDSSIALISSANFSDAAAHRNLEAGVLIRDPVFASGVRQRFASLRTSGALAQL